MNIVDMPKLHSPFIRKHNEKGKYIVTPEIDPEQAWFLEEGVRCEEKLDGTNVSIIIENGKLTRVFNRENDVDLWSDSPVILAVREAYKRGYCQFTDGQHFGEAVGERIQGNPYKLKGQIWLPYDKFFKKNLVYKSWGKYPKDFATISAWFKNDLMPLYALMTSGDRHGFVEGVVFKHPDGRMCKLRRDMFEWYEGKQHIGS